MNLFPLRPAPALAGFIPAHSCSLGGITGVVPDIRTISERIHRGWVHHLLDNVPVRVLEE
jgi:hypothetical protein